MDLTGEEALADPTDALDLRGPRSILVVEDDEDLRELLALALVRLGYLVRTASDGWKALQYLNAGSRPSLILLDLQLPVVDGARFIRIHDADPDICHIPIVVLSGVTGAEVGDVPLVAKPFDLFELLAVIEPFVGAAHIPELLH